MRNNSLKEIEKALKTVDPYVFYGAAGHVNKWDYTVFRRLNVIGASNKFSKTLKYQVGVVRENYIPEGLDEEVIKALKTLAGVKVSEEDIQFEYTVRAGTNTVVEIMTINFTRAESRAWDTN